MLVIAPVPAFAAGGNSTSHQSTTAKSSSKPAQKAPAFHQDTTPLDSAVTGGSSTSGSSGHASVGSTSGEIARVVVGLAIVLAVVYGVYWLLKSAARARMGSGDDSITVVSTTPIPSNRALHLIRAGDELILVGATEQSITPLRVYSAAEAAQMDLQARVAAQPGASGTQKRLSLIETIRQFTVR